MSSAVSALPIVVLVSGNGSNLQAIIDAIQGKRLPARICAVFSNRADAYALERARRAGIPVEVIDHRDFADRRAYDTALMQRIDDYAPQLIVLAGFMRILTPEFVRHYEGRMLNIHPSLLPKYRGLDTHRRVLAAGEHEHGASVHLVTPELDSGPVLLQAVVPVRPDDDPKRLAARVQAAEHRIYPEVVGWFARGRARVEGTQVLLDDQPLCVPLQDRADYDG